MHLLLLLNSSINTFSLDIKLENIGIPSNINDISTVLLILNKGKIISFRDEHPLNILDIVVTLLPLNKGKFISFIEEQSSNKLDIFFTLSV